MVAQRRVVIGRVVDAHGVHGDLRIRWLGDGPENLMRVPALWFSRSEDDPTAKRFEVVGYVGTVSGDVRLRFRGIEDRETALVWKGCLALADSRALEPLGHDEFYWHELIGCQVETTAGRSLGRVEEIWETGPHDVLVVRDQSTGRQTLIPTSREFLTEVDPQAGRIVIDPIPGLLEEPPDEVPDDADPDGPA